MSLNTNYMIAPSLQEYFVDDQSGLALANGYVYFYSDVNRAQLKPIYTLNGTAPNYSYAQLANPVRLSGVGTFVDNNGNDVLPYYYPFDADGNIELYYIVVQDQYGTVQFTRQAYPNIGTSGGGGLSTQYFYNYVRNPQFYAWSTATIFSPVGTGSATTYDYVADDWLYQQDDSSQTIAISRQAFSAGSTLVPGNPVYYLEYSCTGIGSAAQTSNILSQQYKSVQTLSGQQVTVSLQIRGTVNLPISVQLRQFFGTSGGSSNVDTPVITLTTVASATNFQLYSGTVTIPSIQGKNIGSGGDDALILQILFPLNTAATFDIVNVQMVLGPNNPGFVVQSNDDWQQETDYTALYSEFKTGDVKMTLRTPADPGWLLMNDGTIGSLSSGATSAGNYTKGLYTVIWNNVHSNAWAPIYTSTGAASTYGANAETDWVANKRLSLTKALGRVLAGAGAGLVSELVPSVATNSGGKILLTFTQTALLQNGDAFQVAAGSGGALPTGLSPATTYYAIYVSATTVKVATTLANAIAGTAINFTDSGTLPFSIILVSSTWALGQFYGEEIHALSQAELPVTNPTISLSPSNQGAGAAIVVPDGGGTPTGGVISSFGSSTAHNNIQPTSFMNVMIKL